MPYVKILRKLDLGNVKIYPFGISNKKSKCQVFLPRYSFFKNNFDLVTYTFYNKKDLVNQIKLDFKFNKNISIIKKNIYLKNISSMKHKISLVKIDVNGHEYSVVQGLRNIIKKDKPAMIIETDKNIKKIEVLLKRFNYKKYLFDSNKNKFLKIQNNYPLNTYFLQKEHLN